MKVKAAIAPEVLIKRVNRKLAEDGLSLRKARGRVAEQLGDFFIVRDDSVAKCNIDLEQIGREQGALEPWEVVAC